MIRVLAVLLLLFSASSYAAPIRWELHDTAFENGKTLTGFVDFDVAAGIPGWGDIVGFDLLYSDGREFTSDNGEAGSSFAWYIGPFELFITIPLLPAAEFLQGPLGARVNFIRGAAHYKCGECSVEWLPGGGPGDTYYPPGSANHLYSGYIVATAYVPEPSTGLMLVLPVLGLVALGVRKGRPSPS